MYHYLDLRFLILNYVSFSMAFGTARCLGVNKFKRKVQRGGHF